LGGAAAQKIALMLENQKVLAVVPARGGSKGVKLKNLRRVGGLSLVGHVGRVVRQLPWIDRAVVSTDHEAIALEAQNTGLDAPFRRPPALSGDRIGDWDVLHHALAETERIDQCLYDVVVMLQPTSPLRTAQQVTHAAEHFVQGRFDAVWTVSPTDLKFHPLKQLVIEDQTMRLYDPAGQNMIARQQLTPTYHRNGVAYVFTRSCLVEQKTTYGKQLGAVVIDGPVANIDTEEDLAQAEALFQQTSNPNSDLSSCVQNEPRP